MTSEQRERWDADVARARAALSYWCKNAPDCYSPTTEARVAAAEQLAACEALLADLVVAPFFVDLVGSGEVVEIDRQHWRDLHGRAIKLLEEKEPPKELTT